MVDQVLPRTPTPNDDVIVDENVNLIEVRNNEILIEAFLSYNVFVGRVLYIQLEPQVQHSIFAPQDTHCGML